MIKHKTSRKRHNVSTVEKLINGDNNSDNNSKSNDNADNNDVDLNNDNDDGNDPDNSDKKDNGNDDGMHFDKLFTCDHINHRVIF